MIHKEIITSLFKNIVHLINFQHNYSNIKSRDSFTSSNKIL